MTDLFQQTSRLKLRFPFRGNCTTEDLWDLSLESLDELYGTLHSQVKARPKSLLRKKSDKDETVELLDLQIAIVEHIVEVKQAETKARKAEADDADRKRHLLAILADKDDEQLKGKSRKELKKMIADLS